MAASIVTPPDTRDSDGSSPHLANPNVWHKSAPERVSSAGNWDEGSKGWKAWSRYLADRGKPRPPADLLPGKRSPLSWTLPFEEAERDAAGLIDRLHGRFDATDDGGEGLAEELSCWLAEANAADADAAGALESLAWCHALPKIPARVGARLWWELLDFLLESIAEVKRVGSAATPLVRQLLAGELGLTLAYLFPELAPCRDLAKPARQVLSSEIIELLDGEGQPHATELARLRPLFACWTRCRAMGETTSRDCFSREARDQFEWLVRQTLRLTRGDGRQVLTPGTAGDWCPELFQTALDFGGDAFDRKIATKALPKLKGVYAPSTRASLDETVESANHSGWAETGVLRPSWKRNAPWLTVLYNRHVLETELVDGPGALWSGPWALDVRIDGKPLVPAESWEEICWVEDDDVVYLELEGELGRGWSVQRQMLMPRDGRFLFLADAVMGKTPATIEYRSAVRLAEGTTFEPAEETTEGFLHHPRGRALVLPLALPEWRSAARHGRLSEEDGELQLVQQGRGRALYAPLLVDLSYHRRKTAYTWRQLTVGEERRILPVDAAAGYRVQFGARQWLIYRALNETAPRTLLGHNLISDFLFGRFTKDGTVEALLEIE